MMVYPKKRLGLLIIALTAAGLFFHRSISIALEFPGVKTITLSPSNIALPVRLPTVPQNGLPKETRYMFRSDGNQYHLYFVENGASEMVFGDIPAIETVGTSPFPPNEFKGFLDVASPSGIVTYAS